MGHTDPLHEDPDWEALARYRAGESTPEESVAVRQWLAAHPADAALFTHLDALVGQRVASTPAVVTDEQVERALARVHRAMDEPPVKLAARRVAPLGRVATRPPVWGWSVAGLAAAAALAAFVLTHPFASRPRPAEEVAASVAPGQSRATAVGARQSVRLPDGTMVLLGPASRLTVTGSYGRGARDVSLDGVARFSVQHDAAAPFTVHAGSAVVRDIGTVFTVRGSSSAPQRTAVAVLEGVVSLGVDQRSTAAIRLEAGDRGELRPDGGVVAERGAASDADLAWTRGMLVFRDAPLIQVADELRRWYGVGLSVDSTLAARRLTATFEHESVDQVLHTIALALGAQVIRTGDVAMLRPDTAAR